MYIYVHVCTPFSIGAQAAGGGEFPSNPSLPIAIGGVDCNGDESSLRDCGYSQSDHLRVCSHDSDAGVRCQLRTLLYDICIYVIYNLKLKGILE